MGGMANAINIIGGDNGLAAGHSVIVLAALAWVSAAVGDPFLLFAALAMAGALLGFLVWNYLGAWFWFVRHEVTNGSLRTTHDLLGRLRTGRVVEALA
jgi:fatty acid desaturase